MTVPSFDRIDLERLSPQSRWALENLAYPVRVDGAELEIIAEANEISVRVAKRMLSVLDGEVRAQQVGGELPELTRNELVALDLQLKRWGQIYPVVRALVGKAKTVVVVDGGNRKALLDDMELPVQYVDVEVETMEEARALGLSLNLARRHLNSKAVRGVVEAEVLHDPRRSDRAIAELLGVSHPTVAKARRALEKRGVVETVSTRVGRDGVEQTPSAAPVAPRREEKLTAILGQLRDLSKSEERATAHMRADALVVEALKLLGAEAIAETFERVCKRS